MGVPVETTVEWIRERLKVDRLSQRDLAAALGMDPSGVTRLLRGQRKLRGDDVPKIIAFFGERGVEGSPGTRIASVFSLPEVTIPTLSARSGVDELRLLEIKHGRGRPVTMAEADAIAGVLGMDAAGLLSEQGLAPADKEAIRTAARQNRGEAGGRSQSNPPARRVVPVHGAPRPLDRRGHFRDTMQVVEWRIPPEALVDVPGAFGIYIGNDDLSPMLLAGDVAFVHPGRPALPGQRVLVRLNDDEIFLGVLGQGGLVHAPRGELDPRTASGGQILAIVAVSCG